VSAEEERALSMLKSLELDVPFGAPFSVLEKLVLKPSPAVNARVIAQLELGSAECRWRGGGNQARAQQLR
jgi:hypothetical protein